MALAVYKRVFRGTAVFSAAFLTVRRMARGGKRGNGAGNRNQSRWMEFGCEIVAEIGTNRGGWWLGAEIVADFGTNRCGWRAGADLDDDLRSLMIQI